MPTHPTDADRLREQLISLHTLQQAAAGRAAHPPRLGPEAWRGPASELYAIAADGLADELRSIVVELARAQSLLRAEVARATP